MDTMESVVNALPRRLCALGWASLFPVVMLVCFVYWGMRPWTWTVVAAGPVLALLVPAIAADLLAVALIGFALYWFALIQRTSTLPPGSPTTVGYPFHSVVFGNGPPHAVDLAAGVVMLALGAWLTPRTIGAHSELARRNRELLNRVRRLTITRVDAADTATAELQRIERDLHDGAQARLVALGISLRVMERLIRTNPDAAVALVEQARDNSARALAELRALVRGINPPVLAERGLGDAIRALALDCPLPATAEVDLPGLLPPPVETAAYFAVAEALANAASERPDVAIVDVRLPPPIPMRDSRRRWRPAGRCRGCLS
jgi:signal transduction histidine kinase